MKTNAFPQTVEYRGTTATIYSLRNRNTTRYEVRFFDVDGQQQRFTFTTAESAKEFADAAVREVAQNRTNFITLRGPDAYAYHQAGQQLSAAGLTLQEAVRVVVESNRMLAGSLSSSTLSATVWITVRRNLPTSRCARWWTNS